MNIRFLFHAILAWSFLSICVPVSEGETFQVVHTWNSRPSNPYGALCKGSDGNYYGTTEHGGDGPNALYGTVFRMTPAGELSVIHAFTQAEGALPEAGLVEGPDGFFYGTTSNYGQIGLNSYGTFFKISPNGIFTKLLDFSTTSAAYVRAALIFGSDGNLYGTSSGGGANGFGTVFKLTTAGQFTLLHSFTTQTGKAPTTRLLEGPDGNFYGTTSGGQNANGTVFKMTPAGAVTVIAAFTASDNTPNPVIPTISGLTDGGDGFFYGTTSNFVYRLNTQHIDGIVYTFATGSMPSGDLIRGSDGFFYGATIRGGANSKGTIYRVSSTGQFAKLADFPTTFNPIGYASLIESNSPGTFVGVNGGDQNPGFFFKLTPQGVLTTDNFLSAAEGFPSGPLAEGDSGSLFGTTTSNGNSGIFFRVGSDASYSAYNPNPGMIGPIGIPAGGVIKGADGFLWGYSPYSNSFSSGFVYKIAQNSDTPAIVKTFGGGSDGGSPRGRLVQPPDGNFYGVSTTGGTGIKNYGAVFKLTPAGAFTSIASNDGDPNGTLTLGRDGKLYGTTWNGGPNSLGTVFRVTPGASPTSATVVTFTGGADGQDPQGVLLAAPDDNLYGTTLYGGTNNVGTIFKLTPAGVESVLASVGSVGASRPQGSIAIGPDGSIYGVTSEGGANGTGCVYRVTLAGTITVLYSFTTTGPNTPMAGLALGPDGKLYGTTSAGGTGGFGSLFQITAGGALTHVVQFDYSTGNTSLDGFLSAHDGTLYGLNTVGGTGGGGTLFGLKFGPSPVTLAATGLADHGATLNGTINPHGLVSLASFEYGTDPALGTFTALSAGATTAGTAPEAVALSLGSLAPATTYYYRVVGVNAENPTPQRGSILSFKTLPDITPPTLSPVAMTSSNPNPLYAKVGDTITLVFTAGEPIQTPVVTIADQPVAVVNVSANNWKAVLLVGPTTTEGSAAFSIIATDLAGNTAAAVTATTDGRSITVDHTLPVLTLLGANPTTVECLTSYAEPGATANDVVAGNLTGAIQITGTVNANAVGTYTVNYAVTDPAGNTASTSRMVNVVDTTAPMLTIIGANPATVEAGAIYNDAGAMASDAVAGDLTAAIQVASSVDAHTPGNYTVNYSVSDGYNTTTAMRVVQVVDTTAPTITHLPDPLLVTADATNHASAPDLTGQVTATDNVGVTSIVQDPVPGTILPYGPHTVTFTVSDAAHNSTTGSTILTVADGPALVGRYAGLLSTTGFDNTAQNRNGPRANGRIVESGAVRALMELKLTKGRFLTGYLRLGDKRRVWFPGTILPAATLAETLTLNDGSSLALTFDGSGHVTATLSGGAFSLSGDGVLADSGAPAEVPGTYTAILEADGATAPGWLYSVVSKSGAMRLSGKLPDGSTINAGQGSIVDRHGDALIFVLGKSIAHPLLAGRVHFENLATSDFSGALAFNDAPCAANGARFTPAPSGLPAGPYPLTLEGAGIDLTSTVTLLPNNTATVLAPVTKFFPRSTAGKPATGIFYTTFTATLAGPRPVIRGSGIFHQKLGVGVGQFPHNGGVGRIQLGAAP